MTEMTREDIEDIRKHFDLNYPPKCLENASDQQRVEAMQYICTLALQALDARGDLTSNKLWCVHVLGPDDIYAMPSYREAVIEAHRQQIFLANNLDFDDPDQVLVSPRVMLWSGTPEAHAKALTPPTQAEERARQRHAEMFGPIKDLTEGES